jgi:hypothetical protein
MPGPAESGIGAPGSRVGPAGGGTLLDEPLNRSGLASGRGGRGGGAIQSMSATQCNINTNQGDVHSYLRHLLTLGDVRSRH